MKRVSLRTKSVSIVPIAVVRFTKLEGSSGGCCRHSANENLNVRLRPQRLFARQNRATAASLLLKLNKAQILAHSFKQCVAEGNVLIRRFNALAAKSVRRVCTKGFGTRPQKSRRHEGTAMAPESPSPQLSWPCPAPQSDAKCRNAKPRCTDANLANIANLVSYQALSSDICDAN